MLRLPRDGQEYAHIEFSDLPFGVTVEISLDNRTTWQPAAAGITPTERRILLRGPAAPTTEGTLVASSTTLWVRVADTPETVVRAAGLIQLY